mgnify:CR=1 FL=1
MSSGVSCRRASRFTNWAPLNPWSMSTFARGVSSSVELPRLPEPRCVMVIVMRTQGEHRGRNLNTPLLEEKSGSFSAKNCVISRILYEQRSINIISNLNRENTSEAAPSQTVS